MTRGGWGAPWVQSPGCPMGLGEKGVTHRDLYPHSDAGPLWSWLCLLSPLQLGSWMYLPPSTPSLR